MMTPKAAKSGSPAKTKGIKKKEESFRADFSVYATKTADWLYFIEQIL